MENNKCNSHSYELHIEKNYQRHGLGTFLLQALEEVAKHYNMEKLVLTVLNNNEDAKEFFMKVGFKLDDTSPDTFEESDYQILSKCLT